MYTSTIEYITKKNINNTRIRSNITPILNIKYLNTQKKSDLSYYGIIKLHQNFIKQNFMLLHKQEEEYHFRYTKQNTGYHIYSTTES